MTTIHQRPDWPTFTWHAESLMPALAAVRHRQGRLLGRMEALGSAPRAEAGLTMRTEDVVKSSAIEGEQLHPEQVRSAIARRLGLDAGGSAAAARHVEGSVETMLDATQGYAAPLTADRLFAWHATLFPAGRGGLRRITVGAWRPQAVGAMQVASGPYGRERVHFEAPEAARLAPEMAAFLDWFNTPAPLDPVLQAGIAHLWFVTIHPFEDRNGRQQSRDGARALRARGC